ncbi:hypothetical protein AN459_23815 [Pseudomonas aeruginosa]|nr:hypothetical protein AN459_23815 [Pseudomonas aeruginosa]
MSTADTTIIDTAKWEIRVQKVHDTQINSDRTRACTSHDVIYKLFIFRKDIQRQGLVTVIHTLNYRIYIIVFNYRK